ncbi:exodeoxyribonuclease V subunit beta [Geotalea toluenoxydans]
MSPLDLLNTPIAGRNLIEASAGTGKTFAIAALYLRLVLEQHLPVEQILVVTFTEAATKELRERIRRRLTEAEEAFGQGTSTDPFLMCLIGRITDRSAAGQALTNALRSFDEAAIFTIHGFCQRMLQENPFESGSLYDTELVTDERPILRQIAADYWRTHCYNAPSALARTAIEAGLTPEALLELASRHAGNPLIRILPEPQAMVTPQGGVDCDHAEKWLLALKRGFFDYLAAELPKRKGKKNIRFFQDLLLDLHAAVQAADYSLAPMIREHYRAALIDEFQDTDPIQFRIFDRIYPAGDTTPFFLIGDPKQAIYSFRGADIFAYLDAAKSPLVGHSLGENWRSEPRLIQAVNGLFSSRIAPFGMEEIQFHQVTPAERERELLTLDGREDAAPFRFWFAGRRETGKPINKGDAWQMLTDAVAGEISQLLHDGAEGRLCIGNRPIAPGDIAVLVRANRQARLVQRALSRLGIPSVVCSAGNLFESAEAREVLHFLAAVADPANERQVRAALVTDLLGLSGDDLAAIGENEPRWEAVLAEFSRYHDQWQTGGCMTMAMGFMAARQVRSRILALSGGRRRLTNVLHCFEAVHGAAVLHRLGMEGVVSWLAERIGEKEQREEHEIRLETDSDAVQLVTIHKSKGLEYQVVFCPFNWAEYGRREKTVTFHGDDRLPTIDMGSPELEVNRQRAAREAMAENLRLLYVAVTRARHRCYLAWGAFKDAGNSALHYLLHPQATANNGQVSLTDEEILADLHRIAGNAAGSIAIEAPFQGAPQPYPAKAPQPEKCVCRTFTGRIDRDWRVTSFTSFSSSTRHGAHAAELPDRDAAALAKAEDHSDLPASGIFAFPRGAAAGIFFHEIFENLDFTDFATAPGLVEALLKKHGFAGQWLETVLSMTRNVIQARLTTDAGSFALSEIGPDRRLTELEFFFPLARISSDTFREAAASWNDAASDLNLAELAAKLSFTPVRGMLRGFMDLVLEHGGRYYIIDWKSNHLGNRQENYGSMEMAREMADSLYHLQYLLYTVALHGYLQLRLADYDYDRHFGGVFYIFLRGVGGESRDSGIFQARPPFQLIDRLSRLLVETLP